jgi:hypothetical protein
MKFPTKTLISILFMVTILGNAPRAKADLFQIPFAKKPEHVILFIVDGLSYKTWSKVDLPVFKRMIQDGALVEKNYLPPSEHPTQGPYAELHSCSIPNPVMMAGTIFITKNTEYFPQIYFPGMTTAFVANTENYNSLNWNYHYSYQKLGPDVEGVNMGLEFMRIGKPVFMRLHLQEVGEASFQIMKLKENVPWRGNIWAAGSPYIQKLREADRLLGQFLDGLEKLGILSKVTMIVMGDHGEADTGYHPPESVDACITTVVFWGAGIKKGVRIPYSEQIDIVPTICRLLDVDPPKTCQGQVITEALLNYGEKRGPRKMLMKRMIEQFQEYRSQEAEASFLLAKLESQGSSRISLLYQDHEGIRKNFYDISRFMEWKKFASMEDLLKNNQNALDRLRTLLEDLRRARN